jgi:diaminohydroxyphosphoribosylaminopyrimidine deaminase/5-amino-6-(5-phosphoribosylamino)uracil reductase
MRKHSFTLFLTEPAVAAAVRMKEKQADARWMDHALALARHGEGLSSPNPMVGAVLVRGGRKVGEGFHVYDKLKHAEITALESAGRRARGATLYVNLEPCCHRGRTGPCTRAVIDAGVKRVVAAMRDPNPAVAGRGFRQLRVAGIKIDIGLREAEAQELNESFTRWVTARQPFVTLKSAMTFDNKIAWPAREKKKHSRWITSRESRNEVQRMRHASDAILTGIGTVLADNPSLTDRTGRPRRRPLLRVVFDSRLRLPRRSQLVRSAKGDLLIFTAAKIDSRKARRLEKAGAELVRVRRTTGGLDLRAILRELARRKILSVLIEAGTRVNSAALLARIVDKLVIFSAEKRAGSGGTPWATKRAADRIKRLSNFGIQRFGSDYCYSGYLRDVYGNH